MVRIKDFVEENENIKITIEAALSNDLCDPLREEVYTGTLYDIPEHLRDIEVLETGWSIGREINVLTVRKEDIQGETEDKEYGR